VTPDGVAFRTEAPGTDGGGHHIVGVEGPDDRRGRLADQQSQRDACGVAHRRRHAGVVLVHVHGLGAPAEQVAHHAGGVEDAP
jgi:hypothetical protein